MGAPKSVTEQASVCGLRIASSAESSPQKKNSACLCTRLQSCRAWSRQKEVDPKLGLLQASEPLRKQRALHSQSMHQPRDNRTQENNQ